MPRRRLRETLRHIDEPPLGTFVGREREMAQVFACFAAGERLVTLTGLGGVGKTRLARRAATAVAETAHGQALLLRVFVDLSAARTTVDIIDAVAAGLGVASVGEEAEHLAIDAMGRHLRSLGPGLIVLDNLETIVEPVGMVLSRWLAAAPELHVLATSRVRLALRGETVVRLEPLALAAPGGGVPSDAARLVLACAHRVGAAEVSVDDAEQIAEALEGWPLAIELAVARLAVLGSIELLALVRKDRMTLDGGSRDAPERHRSVARTLAWSWDLLDAADHHALSLLATFRGTWSLDAATRILASTHEDPLSTMQRLVDASLVRRVDKGKVARFTLYDVVRDDSERRSAALGLRDEAEIAHARVSIEISRLRLAALSNAGDAFGEVARDARDAVLLEQPNLVAALDRLTRRRKASEETRELTLQTAIALDAVLMMRGRPRAFIAAAGRAIETALDETTSDGLRARAMLALGRARLEGGDPRGASCALEESERSAAKALDVATALRARIWRARLLAVGGSLADAVTQFQRIAVAAHAAGDHDAEVLAGAMAELHGSELTVIWHGCVRMTAAYRHFRATAQPRDALFWAVQAGRAEVEAGHTEAAAALLTEAFEAAQSFGDALAEGMALFGIGTNELDHGVIDAGIEALRRATERLAEVGARRYEGYSGAWLGTALIVAGQYAGAIAALEHAMAVLDEAGDAPNAALFTTFLAVAYAFAGRTSDTSRALTRARAIIVAPEDVWRLRTLAVNEAHLDVLGARAALVVGDAPGATRALEAARRHVAVVDIVHTSLELRVATRLLLQAIDATNASAEPIRIARDGKWFALPGAARVAVPGRGASRRILVLLAERRLSAPDEATSRAELVEAGWPNERLREDAAANRLYVTLDALRRLGLRHLLVRKAAGWVLDARVPCAFADEN